MASETNIENTDKNNDVIEYVSDMWAFGFILFFLSLFGLVFYLGYLCGE